MKYEVQVYRLYGEKSVTDDVFIYEEGWYKYEVYHNHMAANRVAMRLKNMDYIVRVKHLELGE